MAITITNGASTSINVAVTTWREDGKDSSDRHDGYYPIAQAGSDTWHRDDERGYLMAVKINSKVKTYYIFQSSKIIVEDNLVKDQGQTINPLNQ